MGPLGVLEVLELCEKYLDMYMFSIEGKNF